MSARVGQILLPQRLFTGKLSGWLQVLEQKFAVQEYDPSRLDPRYFRILSEEPGVELFIFPAAFTLNTDWISPGFQGALGSIATGNDHVHLDGLSKRGIRFYHAPGCNAASVAEFCAGVWALLFGSVEELCAQHLGIVGYGRIGRLLGRIAAAVGMPFTYYDPLLESVDRSALRRATIISFHVPLTDEGPFATRGMLNEEYLKDLTSCRYLINTSRGKIWTDEGLAAAEGMDLCFDVFPIEPPAHLYGCRHVSPHVAGYNASARQKGLAMVLDAFLKDRGEKVTWPQVATEPTDFSGFTAPGLEDSLLRANPANFSPRRAAYPLRGDIFDLRLDSLSHTSRWLARKVRDALG